MQTQGPPSYYNEPAGRSQQQWATPSFQLQPLAAPVCLPQVAVAGSAAFARGYNEQLMASGVSMVDWLRFLDSLNIAMAGSPPLRVIAKVGKVAKFVFMPYHLIHTGAEVAVHVAGGGQGYASKSMSDKVIKRANEELFAPRGLTVRVCTTGAVRALVRTGHDLPKTSGGEKFAQGAAKIGKDLPILGGLIRKLGPESEHLPEDPRMSLTERRIASLGPNVMPLNMNVPPPVAGQGYTEQSNAAFIREQGAKAYNEESRADANRHLLAVARGEAQPVYAGRPEFRRSSSASSGSLSSASSVPSDAEDEKDMREWREKMAKRERKAVHSFQTRRDTRKFEAKIQKNSRKDAQNTDDLLWLVLMNASQECDVEESAHV